MSISQARTDDKPLPSYKDVARDLGRRAPDLARWLLGAPTSSNNHTYRYRNKGSLVVIIAGSEAGHWFDHDPDTVNDGRTAGDALHLVAHVNNIALRDAYKKGLEFLGLNPDETAEAKVDTQTLKQRIDRALAIWSEARAIKNTIAERYLRERGIACALPRDLRFHPACYNSETKTKMPAMLALFRDIADDRPCGVHRTYLAKDGSGKALLKEAKKGYGRMKGAAIKLSPDDTITSGLGISEGIETGLSLLSAGWHAIWAAGSAGAIENFPILGGVESLSVFADNDFSERGLRSARMCASRWQAAGRESSIIFPRSAGCDWNDVLRAA